ncbi:MAG: calcium-binding protein [Geminicoccaceae bacterium]
MSTIYGTADPDLLIIRPDGSLGTSAGISFVGPVTLAGDDTIFGYAGSDTLDGGAGNDEIHGGDAGDTLTGDDVNRPDVAGNDRLYGEAGTDSLNGLGGDDLLAGGEGTDTLKGGDGNDQLIDDDGGGPYAYDVLYGGAGNDIVWSNGGADLIHGGDGSDQLLASGAGTSIYGDAGVDRLMVSGGAPSLVDGGTGFDSLQVLSPLDLSGTAIRGVEELRTDGGLVISPTQLDAFAQIGTVSSDRLIDSIELAAPGSVDLAGKIIAPGMVLVGSAGADAVLLSDADHLSFYFLGGRDSSESGADSVRGGGGVDYLYGWGGNDSLNGGAGADLIFGGLGRDTLLGGDGVDQLHGDSGNDTLKGGDGGDLLFGEGDDDLVQGGDGYDHLSGGAGNDRLSGNGGKDQLDGGAGDDQLTGGAGSDRFIVTPGGYDLSGTRGQADVVLDFQNGVDRLTVTGFGPAYDTAAEILAAATVSGGSTFITLVEPGGLFPPATTIELRGFTQLDAADFAGLAP